MLRALLMTVGVMTASAVNPTSISFFNNLVHAKPDQLRLGQAAYPIPDVPENFEMTGKYWQYVKASGELKDLNILFTGKISKDINCWMFE